MKGKTRRFGLQIMLLTLMVLAVLGVLITLQVRIIAVLENISNIHQQRTNANSQKEECV